MGRSGVASLEVSVVEQRTRDRKGVLVNRAFPPRELMLLFSLVNKMIEKSLANKERKGDLHEHRKIALKLDVAQGK